MTFLVRDEIVKSKVEVKIQNRTSTVTRDILACSDYSGKCLRLLNKWNAMELRHVCMHIKHSNEATIDSPVECNRFTGRRWDYRYHRGF